jgi:hypothetical protein
MTNATTTNKQITWSITEENARKIINQFQNYGRKVDTYLAWKIFDRNFKGHEFAVNTCGEVCEMYRSAIWNNGAVK